MSEISLHEDVPSDLERRNSVEFQGVLDPGYTFSL